MGEGARVSKGHYLREYRTLSTKMFALSLQCKSWEVISHDRSAMIAVNPFTHLSQLRNGFRRTEYHFSPVVQLCRLQRWSFKSICYRKSGLAHESICYR